MFIFFHPLEYPVFSDEFRKARAVLDVVTAEKSGLSAGTLKLWLYIAENLDRLLSEQGLPLTQIAEELDIPYGTLGRQLDLLEDGYQHTKGLRWIERGIDEKNRRVRRLRLTREGLHVAFRIDEVLSGRPNPWKNVFLDHVADESAEVGK